MPKKLFKRYIPETNDIKKQKHVRFFGKLLHDSNLWHLNQYSVATGFSIGLFCAFMPMPFQMILASSLAIALRANLPLSMVLVWISNPITMPPMFYFAYKVGTLVIPTTLNLQIELTWQSLADHLMLIWQPLLIGTFICGITSAIFANLVIRLVWRTWVIKRWHSRRRTPRQKD